MYCGMPVGAAILSLIAATEFGANWRNVLQPGLFITDFRDSTDDAVPA